MSGPARAMSKFDALTELKELEAAGQILLEGAADEHRVSLDGWDPEVGKVNGAVVGVVVRYWGSGTKAFGQPSGGSAPDRPDPRNALALVRLCQWLKDDYGVTDPYHLGIYGGGRHRVRRLLPARRSRRRSLHRGLLP